MSSLRLFVSSGLLLLCCFCLTTAATASSVEYQFFGTNQEFVSGPPDDNVVFDLTVPTFITTATTETSWNSCTYYLLLVPKACTQITFTPGFVSGSNTYDALSLAAEGGNGFSDMLFDPGTFGMYGTFPGQTSSQSPTWFGSLTISPVGAPEPASLVMLGGGLLSAFCWKRKRLL
jgi:PEP-CTERM motif